MSDPVERLNEVLEGRYRVILLSDGEASDGILARFAVERQALAVMDHPWIAKVFDAGVTADRRPYFVMEIVDGSRIVDYCDERRLGLADGVRVFLDVCRAVQNAHQKGLVHRDLKPSNVLVAEVDGRPQPRVSPEQISGGRSIGVGRPLLRTRTGIPRHRPYATRR